MANDDCINDLLAESHLKRRNNSSVKKTNSVVIKTITKKVLRRGNQDSVSNIASEGSLAVINLNEEECNAEEKLIKNNLTVITNYLNKPEGKTHFISVDMRSVSVSGSTSIEDEDSGLALNDVYNIRIDEGCEKSVREISPDDILSLQENTNDGRDVKIDKDDPCSRLHFLKFLRKDGEANKKVWQCGICGKEFKHQYTLLRHVTMHTDERNFTCEDCGKSFRLMSTLSQHKVIHRKAKPYVCAVCKKTFSRISTLISHKKIHFEDKKYKCSICHKSFHQKGNLKNHFFTHTDERPFRCKLCGKGFNQLSNLACHKARSHVKKIDSPVMPSNNKYMCNHCNLLFVFKSQLQHHEEISHGIENISSPHKNIKQNQIHQPILRKKKMQDLKIINATPNQMPEKEKSGILIDEIKTNAMTKCIAKGSVAYALFKPIGVSPVLVKVCIVSKTNHMLVPAVAEELRNLGKFTVTQNVDGNKTVQVRIPVVAYITQHISPEGEVKFDIKPPLNEEQNSESNGLSVNMTTKDGATSFVPSKVSSSVDKDKKILTQQFVLISEQDTGLINSQSTDSEFPSDTIPQEEKFITVDCLKADDLEYSQELNLMSVPLSSQDLQIIAKDEILDLAENVQYQYLRPTGVIGEYEIVDQIVANEAHEIKPIPDGNTYFVDPSQFSNLMGVFQLAGYELDEEDQLIT